MERYSADVAADRSGVARDEIVRLTELGILAGDVAAGYTDRDVRRVQIVQALERAGLPIHGVAQLVRGGLFSLQFLDDAGSSVFAGLSELTFADLSQRTRIPVDQLAVLRDVTGGKTAGLDDRVREDELEILPPVHPIGPVELEGVSGVVELYAARRA